MVYSGRMNPEASVIPYYRCASFWKRLYAYGYDSLIITIISALVGWQIGGIAHAQSPEMQQNIDALVGAGLLPAGTDAATLTATLGSLVSSLFSWSDLVLPLMVSALYNIWFIAGAWQATPGKRFCGIHVVNADGSPLSLLQSAYRHAASGLSTLLVGLPYLTIFYTKEKLAPHDMLCKTRVVLGKTL
jgi:uncharacterized RDD family membrane protein YckC